jgi:hypothetical protein
LVDGIAWHDMVWYCSVDAVRRQIAIEIAPLRESLAKEQHDREHADEELVQAVNHYTAALQVSLLPSFCCDLFVHYCWYDLKGWYQNCEWCTLTLMWAYYCYCHFGYT